MILSEKSATFRDHAPVSHHSSQKKPPSGPQVAGGTGLAGGP
jgi:hypothetical protein